MKRLVDEAHPAGSAQELLTRAVRAIPRREPRGFEMERILARVRSRSTGRPVAMVRLAVAATLLLLAMAATAAVTLRLRGAHRPTGAATPASAQVPSLAPPPPAAVIAEPTAMQAATAVSADPPAPSVALPSAGVGSRVSRSGRDGEDPALVLQAIQALRNNGDPARASSLLSQYLSAHPRGVLSEDALALSIEAANARHDTRAASDLGRRYLAQFPAGRYRTFALQASQPGTR
jgi:hypothetical protein